MKVVKFGGSSMADAGQYRKVRDILLADPDRRVVVVSAAGKRNKADHKITDLLYLCYAHTQYGVDCSGVFEMIVSRYREIQQELGLTLDLEPEFAALKQRLDAKTVSQDELASRGEYFSAKLMADPRIVENPQTIPEVTYDELRELSYSGAQVLHEGTIFPVREKNIPLNIRNTNAPEDPGTMIQEKFQQDSDPHRFITGITGKKDFTVISVNKRGMGSQVGVLRRILTVLERHEISVDYVPNGIDNVSVVMSTESVASSLYAILGEIQKEVEPDQLDVHDQIAVVAAVGRKMAFRPGISGQIFAALGQAGINIRMINQGPDELNIIFGVDNRDFANAIRVLYNSFVKE